MTFTEQVQQFWLRNAKIRNGQLPDYPLKVEDGENWLTKLALALALICFGIALVCLAPLVFAWFMAFMPDEPAAPQPPSTTQQESLYQDLEDRGMNIPITQ